MQGNDAFLLLAFLRKKSYLNESYFYSYHTPTPAFTLLPHTYCPKHTPTQTHSNIESNIPKVETCRVRRMFKRPWMCVKINKKCILRILLEPVPLFESKKNTYRSIKREIKKGCFQLQCIRWETVRHRHHVAVWPQLQRYRELFVPFTMFVL